MPDRKINVTFRLSADSYFTWKALVLSHGCTIEGATDQLIKEKLKELGVEVRQRPEDSAAEKVPGLVMRTS